MKSSTDFYSKDLSALILLRVAWIAFWIIDWEGPAGAAGAAGAASVTGFSVLTSETTGVIGFGGEATETGFNSLAFIGVAGKASGFLSSTFFS